MNRLSMSWRREHNKIINKIAEIKTAEVKYRFEIKANREQTEKGGGVRKSAD